MSLTIWEAAGPLSFTFLLVALFFSAGVKYFTGEALNLLNWGHFIPFVGVQMIIVFYLSIAELNFGDSWLTGNMLVVTFVFLVAAFTIFLARFLPAMEEIARNFASPVFIATGLVFGLFFYAHAKNITPTLSDLPLTLAGIASLWWAKSIFVDGLFGAFTAQKSAVFQIASSAVICWLYMAYPGVPKEVVATLFVTEFAIICAVTSYHHFCLDTPVQGFETPMAQSWQWISFKNMLTVAFVTVAASIWGAGWFM